MKSVKLNKRINHEKHIIISDCIQCPIIKDCKSWKALDAKTKFTLKVGIGISEFILKTCPLDDWDEKKD